MIKFHKDTLLYLNDTSEFGDDDYDMDFKAGEPVKAKVIITEYTGYVDLQFDDGFQSWHVPLSSFEMVH